MCYEVQVTVAKFQDLTESTILEELKALIELAKIPEDSVKVQMREDRRLSILLEESTHVQQLLQYICRSVFVKQVKVQDLEVTYGREFIFKPRPLERIDTVSAPLEPLLSRLLVNLARVDHDKKVLDPFCGVGGILHEAKLVGAHIIGTDIVHRYVKTAMKNLAFDLDGVVQDSSTFFTFKDNIVDAIISDPPYSKLSLVDKDLDSIYYNAIRECSRVLKPGGYLAWTCIACVDVENMLMEVDFEVLHVGYQQVHRSMIRKIVLARKV